MTREKTYQVQLIGEDLRALEELDTAMFNIRTIADLLQDTDENFCLGRLLGDIAEGGSEGLNVIGEIIKMVEEERNAHS